MTAAQASEASQGKSRRYLVVFGVIAVVAVVAGLAWRARQLANRSPARHVVVISLDTTRADHFGCYGNTWIRTPNLDALSAESILFTDYMTVISTTLASHTSLFTGKYPHTHGVPANGHVIHEDNLMLAEILEAAGFHAAGFLGSFALDSRFNFAQGFDHFDQEFDILAKTWGMQNERRAETVTDAVISYLERNGVPPHLFLFVHYFDPHVPYDPPPPFDTMYGDAAGAIEPENHPALVGSHPPKKLGRLLRYAGEVSYMDHHVGRLLEDLKRRGVLNDALLIVTSDHGENMGENEGPRFDHGWTTYQVDMHAVAIIRLPGAAHAGTRLDLPVASIDVLPTVLNYLGMPVPAGVEGEVIDLKNLDRNPTSRTRFGEATKPWEDIDIDPRWFNNTKPRCVREGPFKYIRTAHRDLEELYDLSSDLYERRNLLASLLPEMVARAAELRRKLEAWTAAQNPLPTHFDEQRREENLRRLQALGYLQGYDEDENQDD